MKKQSKKRNFLRISAILLIVAGLSVLLYPHICQQVYTMKAENIIKEYNERVENKKYIQRPAGEEEDREEDDLEWLYHAIVKYNNDLYENKQSNLTEPFSYEQVDFSLTQFGLDEDMIGYMFIPKIDIRLPIYLGANSANMSKGAAHLTQTSIPVGGVNTNAVIAAHRGMGTAAMFRNIDKIEVGDKITITNFYETLTYRAEKIAVIEPTDIDRILIQKGRDLITLITCHPYRHNYQRYVVFCERVLE